MANPEHLEILKQGVEQWNRWRSEHRELRIDLRGANLGRADLQKSDLSLVDLGRADLHEANLDGAHLVEANLGWADLTGANLREASLFGTNLQGADLARVDLNKAKLGRVFSRGADLGEVFQHLNTTSIGDVDLSEVKGLQGARHWGPCTIGIDTLVKTANGLSKNRDRQGEVESFLRGAGVMEEYLGFFHSQIGQPIEFYSCFISYSHADKSFARRLYDSLQGRGIRCWLDEHALVPGDRIVRVVNEAIRVNDKLLLCCSQTSLRSSWVEDEVAAAIKKERSEGRDVLIPLNLDGYFLNWQGDHSVRIQERFAADFTGWESDNARFEREFEKVVRALRPRARD